MTTHGPNDVIFCFFLSLGLLFVMRAKTGLFLFQKHVESHKSPQHDRTEFRVENKELTFI